MEGKERRKMILNILSEDSEPVSGSALATRLLVSRQVIVQDIALLRAVNKNILSTTKGYVLYSREDNKVNRTFMVKHEDDQIEDELNTIVDAGGKVLDVIVDHKIYGSITVDLIIGSRRDVMDFVAKVNSSTPLMKLTNGSHIHTVEADCEEVLDRIEIDLFKKGYLIQH